MAPGRIFAAAMIFALLILTAGCSGRGGGNESVSRYAADIIYVDRDIDAAMAEGRARELLKHVLTSEATYYGKENGLTAGDAELTEMISSVKKRFAAALFEGYYLSPEEEEELEKNIIDRLYLTYLTDDAVRAAYDDEYDSYSAEAFSAFMYGIGTAEYADIFYEQAVISKYTAALKEKATEALTDSEIAEYYASHSRKYDFAEVTVILFDPEPKDIDASLNSAAVLADSVNASDNREEAADAIAAEYSAESSDTDDAGNRILYFDAEYTGLYGEILNNISSHEGEAYVTFYSGKVYIVYVSGIVRFDTDDLKDENTSAMVRDDLASEKAAGMIPEVPLRIEWY